VLSSAHVSNGDIYSLLITSNKLRSKNTT